LTAICPRSPLFPFTTLFRSDGRLVEHVQYARQPRADLRCQTDALRFATRQRARRAREIQIVQAHAHEEGQTTEDFLEHLLRDGADRKSTRLNSSHVKISYAV